MLACRPMLAHGRKGERGFGGGVGGVLDEPELGERRVIGGGLHPAAPGEAAGGAQQRVPFVAGQPGKPGSLEPGRDVDLREQHLGGAVAPGSERGKLGQRGFLVVGKPEREAAWKRGSSCPRSSAARVVPAPNMRRRATKTRRMAHGGPRL